MANQDRAPARRAREDLRDLRVAEARDHRRDGDAGADAELGQAPQRLEARRGRARPRLQRARQRLVGERDRGPPKTLLRAAGCRDRAVIGAPPFGCVNFDFAL
jgi:hypothetical protein